MYKTEIAVEDGEEAAASRSIISISLPRLNYKTLKIIGDQRKRFRDTFAIFYLTTHTGGEGDR